MSDTETQIVWNARSYPIDYWDCSAKTTYNQNNPAAGQWFMSATDILAIDAAEWANSPEGAINLFSQGQIQFQCSDNPGRSPFIIVYPMNGDQIQGLEVRYAMSVAEGDHYWTDWMALSWDTTRLAYVDIGPTSDGSIGQISPWGFVQIRRAGEEGDWTVSKIRVGWAFLG